MYYFYVSQDVLLLNDINLPLNASDGTSKGKVISESFVRRFSLHLRRPASGFCLAKWRWLEVKNQKSSCCFQPFKLCRFTVFSVGWDMCLFSCLFMIWLEGLMKHVVGMVILELSFLFFRQVQSW